ncbi:MAG: hypothetical protein WA104_05025, partial [Thermodesulfovibrionales bacterium]
PHTSPSPSSPPLKGGVVLQPSPLEGEGKGEGALLMNALIYTTPSALPYKMLFLYYASSEYFMHIITAIQHRQLFPLPIIIADAKIFSIQ